MRIGLFLLLSLALHTTALTSPVLFLRPHGEELFPVVVLSLEDKRGDGIMSDGRTEGKSGRPAGLKHTVSVKKAEERSGGKQETTEWKHSIGTSVNSADVPEGIEVASDMDSSVENGGGVSLQHGTGSGGEDSGGKGNSGGGNGVGVGQGGGSGLGFVQVSYVYNPKPHYPEKAREEGREGTVILRVLVDEEGKVRSVEVNRSSGFEAFNRAAVDTVRRWRFSPARYGERRVESWVRIPVVFRLADVRD
jgi:TonB family protein